MPKTKKSAKKTTKKKTTKRKAVKKAVKKKVTKKKPVKKTATKKLKTSKKKKTVKKTVKKTTKKTVKKKSTKKKAKKTVKTKKAVKKKTAKKKVVRKTPAKKTVKKTLKKAAKAKKTQKTSKKVKTSMTETEIKTKIEPQITTPQPQPTIKEDRKLDTTMDELDIAPIEIESDEDYMRDDQLEHFRKILIRWKHQLMSEVDSTMGHMQEDGLSFPDPIDRAAQEEGFNLELRTRDRERKLIKKIEAALDMIETGEYGYCEDCGAEIGVRRLEARPTATKCIDCKTYAEIREKQSGG